MIVQIYEIQDTHEAERCIELGLDHIGSVLLSKEAWRDPDLKAVFHATEGTRTRNSLIPLFQETDIVNKAIDYYRPHVIHFCETLTDDGGLMINLDPLIQLQAEVKKKFPEIKVMRSIPIPQNGAHPHFPTLKIAKALEPVSDMFLTDTWLGKEPVEGYIGITGKTVDWETAKALVARSEIPVILAGGLSPENVFDALMKTGAAGADSCTLTNQTNEQGDPIRFKKDFNKVARFVKEVEKVKNSTRRKVKA